MGFNSAFKGLRAVRHKGKIPHCDMLCKKLKPAIRPAWGVFMHLNNWPHATAAAAAMSQSINQLKLKDNLSLGI